LSCRLWAALLGVKWDVKSLRQFINVFHIDGGVRLICRLPDAMLRDLVNLTPRQVAAAAEKWGTTEGLDNPPARVRMIIAGLANLARKAAEVNPSVYLWNSV
jgi:hypothetical protein